MKILVITAAYPPDHFGGYELLCRDVVEEWRIRGHEVTVLTGSARHPTTAVASAGPERSIRRELDVRLEADRLPRIPLLRRRDRELRNVNALVRLVQETRPDVMSVWHMAGVSLGTLTQAQRAGIPLVCVVGDEWPIYVPQTDPWMKLWRRFGPRSWKIIERLTGVVTGLPPLAESATFCFASEFLRQRCLSSSQHTYNRAAVCYHGISLHEFPVAKAENRPQWGWRILSAGRLDPRKGFATVIRALAHLPPQTHLTICSPSDTSYRRVLSDTAQGLGVLDRVDFQFLGRGDLRNAYLDADVFVFPSEWDEPFGMAPLEAMACGTPVIATGSGGSAEFLEADVNCLLFQAGDPVRLADQVRTVALEAKLRERLSHQGIKTAARFTTTKLAQDLEHWHSEVIQERGRDRPSRDGAAIATGEPGKTGRPSRHRQE